MLLNKKLTYDIILQNNTSKAVKEESRRGFCPREKIPEAGSIFTI